MAVIDPNEIFFTAFEPKVQNRFIMYVDGVPSYTIKGISSVGFSQEEIVLNHINTYRKIKGKLKWNDLTMTMFDPITPSGAQAVMEWVRLEWIIKGAFVKAAEFGEYNWDNEAAAQNLTVTIGMDYCVLNY